MLEISSNDSKKYHWFKLSGKSESAAKQLLILLQLSEPDKLKGKELGGFLGLRSPVRISVDHPTIIAQYCFPEIFEVHGTLYMRSPVGLGTNHDGTPKENAYFSPLNSEELNDESSELIKHVLSEPIIHRKSAAIFSNNTNPFIDLTPEIP